MDTSSHVWSVLPAIAQLSIRENYWQLSYNGGALKDEEWREPTRSPQVLSLSPQFGFLNVGYWPNSELIDPNVLTDFGSAFGRKAAISQSGVLISSSDPELTSY
jgi:hypothetical protein